MTPLLKHFAQFSPQIRQFQRKLKANARLIRPYLVEVPLYFLFMQATEAYLNGFQLSMHSLSPHPYLIGVLAFSLVYGFVLGGVVASIAAILITPWKNVFDLHAMEVITQMFTPLTFVAFGLLIGSIVSFLRNQNTELKATLRESNLKMDDLELDRERLTHTNLVLERKVVSREDTVLTLYEASESLGSLSLEEIYDAIPNLLSSYLKAHACSVYVHENDALICVVNHGWKSLDAYTTVYPKDHPLYQELLQNQGVLTAKELKPLDDAVLVAPLMAHQHLYGMLKIEQLDFLELTPTTVKLMQMLQHWVMQAITNARSYGMSQLSQIRDENLGAYTESYFQERLKQELRLSRRYQLDLSVSFFEIAQFEDMSPSSQQRVLMILCRVMQFQFRDDDLIAHIRSSHSTQFAILHPFTNTQGAQVAIERCLKDIHGYDFKPFENQDTVLQVKSYALNNHDTSFAKHPLLAESYQTAMTLSKR